MGGGSVTTKVGTLVFVPTNVVIILVMFVVIFVKNELLNKYEFPI